MIARFAAYTFGRACMMMMKATYLGEVRLPLWGEKASTSLAQPSRNNINSKTPSDRTSTIKILCQVCSNFHLDLTASETVIPHHASYADLIESAEAGCLLCAAIKKVQEEVYSSLPELDREPDK
jgi:hypothetical protein